jgi:hypothetical protein
MNFALLALLTAVLFLRPEELVPEIAGARLYLVVIAVALVVAAPQVLGQLRPGYLRWHPVSAAVLGMLGAGVLAHLGRLNVEAASGFATEFGKVVLFYLLVVGVLNTRERLDAYLGWLVVLVAGVSGLVLAQHHGLIELEALAPVYQNDVNDDTGEVAVLTRVRGTGIFNDPNDLCLVLGLGSVCGLYRASVASGPLARVGWCVPVAVFLYTLALTKSRGGLVGVGAAAAAYVFVAYGWRRGVLVLAAAVPAAAALFAGRQTDLDVSAGTGQDRIRLWSEGLSALTRINPITGIGPWMYTDEAVQDAHNSFVHAYVETGLVGGTIFLGAFAAAAAVLAWHAATDPDGPGLAAFLFAAVVGYAAGVMSLSRTYVLPTYLVLGLTTAYLNVARRDPPEWYRLHPRLLKWAAGLGVAGLLGTKAFVMAFARYGGG